MTPRHTPTVPTNRATLAALSCQTRPPSPGRTLMPDLLALAALPFQTLALAVAGSPASIRQRPHAARCRISEGGCHRRAPAGRRCGGTGTRLSANLTSTSRLHYTSKSHDNSPAHCAYITPAHHVQIKLTHHIHIKLVHHVHISLAHHLHRILTSGWHKGAFQVTNLLRFCSNCRMHGSHFLNFSAPCTIGTISTLHYRLTVPPS